MTRKIKIYTTAGMPGTIETNVTTLGQLKPLLSQREINYSGMKMLVGETKNELSVDEATLPEGDFKLYLMPAKTKSGVDFDEMEENIDNIITCLSRLEDKINRILTKTEEINSSKLYSPEAKSSLGYNVPSTPTLSYEDQKEIEELKRLSGSGSSNEWDN